MHAELILRAGDELPVSLALSIDAHLTRQHSIEEMIALTMELKALARKGQPVAGTPIGALLILVYAEFDRYYGTPADATAQQEWVRGYLVRLRGA